MESQGFTPVEKKPWFIVVLLRIDQVARYDRPLDLLRALGERLSAELLESDRVTILAELDRLLHENARGYEQIAVPYLRSLRGQIARRPWYLIILSQMAVYAGNLRFMNELSQSIQDFRLCETSAEERVMIIAEIERMLSRDRHRYLSPAVSYLELLLDYVRTGF